MNKILVLFIFSLSAMNLFSQTGYKTTNYYLVNSFLLITYYYNDAENFRDLFPEYNDLRRIINLKTNLNDVFNTNYNKDSTIIIWIEYNIKKNPFETDQYYGYYMIRVTRRLLIPQINFYTSPDVQIFTVNCTFVYNNPNYYEQGINSLKSEIDENILLLIDEFALDYKSSY